MGQNNRHVICAGCSYKFKMIDTTKYRKKRFCGNENCRQIIDQKIKHLNYRKQQRKIIKGTFRPGVFPELRKRILERDNNTCMKCNAISVQMQIHHIIPLSDNGDDNISNLITLCSSCHTEVHKKGYENYVSSFKSYTEKMEASSC